MDPATASQQVEAIKARVQSAQQRRVRAEYQRDQALAQRDKALADMSAEFGVDGLDAARSLLQSMQAEFQALLAQVTESLERINA